MDLFADDFHPASNAMGSSGDNSGKKHGSGDASMSNGVSEHKSSKHHHSSSKDNDRHHSSSKHSSSSSKDKHRSSSSSKHHSSSSSKHGSSSSSSAHREGSSKSHSSSSNHKDGSSKHRSSSSHRDGSSKHHNSSSSSSHKHSSSSSSSKHRDPSKPSSSSSSSKHISSKDHHRSSSSSKNKDRHATPRDNGVSVATPKPAPVVSPIRVKPEPVSPIKMRQPAFSDDEDDCPLSARLSEAGLLTGVKKEERRTLSDDDDDEPLTARVEKVKNVKKEPVDKKRKAVSETEDFKPPKAKKAKKTEVKQEKKAGGRKKPVDDGLSEDKWEWWKDDKKEDGVKWRNLEHAGPVFAPPYEPLPRNVRFHYNGKSVQMSSETEEVATFYGKMLDHDYTTKEIFNKNFLRDWRKVMTREEREMITDLGKCRFNEINEYFKQQTEERKAMTKDQKLELKKKNEDIVKEYGFCIIDDHRQKIGNFRIEPPGLFRGRGDHPKQGMLKRRTEAEDVIINCSKGANVPDPPAGHKWKEVRHDNSVTWLACWTENVQNSTKYVMLNAASKLKGEKDWKKYETARSLHRIVDKIRAQYREDWKSKEMRVRQRSVAMYFIDKLALRAGNEKDEDTADTVGCCSIRVEHIKLHEQLDDKAYVVEFDFLGKDSIRYYNRVAVEKRVFKNLQLFTENKSEGDDLFDRLNTSVLNKHLQCLMDGLTAKVFRTYNASRTLQDQLNLLTDEDDKIPAKLLSYNRANRAVAVLCNHQRAVSKNFGKQMETLQSKIDAKRDLVHQVKQEYKAAKADFKALKTETKKKMVDKKKIAVDRMMEQLQKLEVQQTDKDENKDIALGTSKLNYLDPRISVAWAKKHDVPLEKVYNKTQREKFAWAIDMADEEFEF